MSPAINFDNGEKRGFLYKTGKEATERNVVGWKKRWVVLMDWFLYYFDRKDSASPLGAIPLQDSVVKIYNVRSCNTFSLPYKEMLPC